eukprot:COSAG06_NODE_2310_length_7103_cov_30.593232_2_plen_203_part_00
MRTALHCGPGLALASAFEGFFFFHQRPGFWSLGPRHDRRRLEELRAVRIDVRARERAKIWRYFDAKISRSVVRLPRRQSCNGISLARTSPRKRQFRNRQRRPTTGTLQALTLAQLLVNSRYARARIRNCSGHLPAHANSAPPAKVAPFSFCWAPANDSHRFSTRHDEKARRGWWRWRPFRPPASSGAGPGRRTARAQRSKSC